MDRRSRSTHRGDEYPRSAIACMKQSITFATWKSKAVDFNARAGAVGQRAIVKITWYRNPPQVEPGLYAAVDFSSRFAQVDLHCGFLAWREQLDGKFLLVREEENSSTTQHVSRSKRESSRRFASSLSAVSAGEIEAHASFCAQVCRRVQSAAIGSHRQRSANNGQSNGSLARGWFPEI